MFKLVSRALVSAIAIGLMMASPSFAQRQNYGPALTFDGGIHGESIAQMYGWTFDVVSPGFHINKMGVWDQFSDGVAGDGNGGHPVGLWDGAGTLIASTIVDQFSTEILVNGEGSWRVNTIPDLLLTPGSYTLGALYPENDPDLFTVQAVNLDSIPELIYGTPVTNGANVFERPTIAGPNNAPGYFGPIIGHVSAPEPGSFALLAIGVAGGLIARRRRSAG